MSVRGGVTDFVTFAIQWLEQVDCGFMLTMKHASWVHVNDEACSLFRHIKL